MLNQQAYRRSHYEDIKWITKKLQQNYIKNDIQISIFPMHQRG